MKMVIKQVILWPKNDKLGLRTLKFEPKKLNLVTGRSRTGKSAITFIIDYVLGSSKCAIPVGEIRTHVAWYGVLLDIGGAELLVAREEPEDRVESGNYCVDEGVEVEIPKRPVKTTNRESFKERMNRLAGLPSLEVDVPEPGRSSLGRPSFRDMASFNFLPQHIVANPYTLFYKADSDENRKKLRTVFPLVLGAVSASDIAGEHETAELEAKHRRLKAQKERRERAAETWKADALALHGRAVDLGLLPATTPRPTAMNAAIADLRDVVIASSAEQALPGRPTGATVAVTERLEAVRRQEREVDRSLTAARTRLDRVRSLQGGLEDFAGVAATQSERLRGVGWLQRKLNPSAPCPVCGNPHDGATHELARLAAAATELGEQQRVATAAPAGLEREEQQLRQRVSEQEDMLRELRKERQELERERAKSGSQNLEEVFRFLGRVEEALRNLRQAGGDGELKKELDAVEKRLAELRAQLDPARRRARMDAALQVFSRSAAHYAAFMVLERRNDAISLQPEDLSLVFTSARAGRKDYLWEIGSGANWMGYHIAALLALHEVFLRQDLSPVPSFLVIDQPSQVYFPTGQLDRQAEGTPRRSHDIEATRRIFETLEEGLRRLDFQVQIIVTEHVDDRTLDGMTSLHVVADWHGDDVDWLIPRAWLAANDGAP